jgi:hypothetical protein
MGGKNTEDLPIRCELTDNLEEMEYNYKNINI